MKRTVIAAAIFILASGIAFAQSATSGTTSVWAAPTTVQGPPSQTAINDVVYGFLAPIEHDIMVVSVVARRTLAIFLILDIIVFGIGAAAGRVDSLGPWIMKFLGMATIVFVVENFAIATAWPGEPSFTPSEADQSASQNTGSALTYNENSSPWAQQPPSTERADTQAFARHPGLAGRFLDMLVGTAAGTTGVNANVLVNPGSVLFFAQSLVLPVKAMVSNAIANSVDQNVQRSGPFYEFRVLDFYLSNNGPLGLLLGQWVYTLAVWVIYIVLTVQLCLAILEFYIILLFAEILVPFIAFEPIRFIGANAFSSVIGQAVRTAIVVTVITLGTSVMWGVAQHVFSPYVIYHANGQYTINMNNSEALVGTYLMALVVMVAGSALLLYLSLHAPSLAMSLLTGSPSLSAPHMFQTAYAGARLFQAGGALASGVAGAVGGFLTSRPQAVSNSYTPRDDQGMGPLVSGGGGGTGGGPGGGVSGVGARGDAAAVAAAAGVGNEFAPPKNPPALDMGPPIANAMAAGMAAGSGKTFIGKAPGTGLFTDASGKPTLDIAHPWHGLQSLGPGESRPSLDLSKDRWQRQG